MHAVCSGADRRETIVFISTRCDERVESELNKARALRRGQIVTLFADQIAPVCGASLEDQEAEA